MKEKILRKTTYQHFNLIFEWFETAKVMQNTVSEVIAKHMASIKVKIFFFF